MEAWPSWSGGVLMKQAPFQRAHFQFLAGMVRDMPDDTCRLLDMRTQRPVDLRRIVAEYMCKSFKDTHAHFKQSRFMSACGLE